MSPPAVRVNTFIVMENEKSHVDPITKIFIISEAILGLDRLPLIARGKLIYVFMTFIIHIIWTMTILYMTLTGGPTSILMWNKIIQYSICTLLSYTQCKWMLSYYDKLNAFDTQTACRPKVSINCIRNIVQSVFSVLLITGMYTLYSTKTLKKHRMSLQFMPLNILHVLEMHYIGHLLGLLVPRLNLINYYIESSLSSAKLKTHQILKEFVYIKTCNQQKETQCHMRKLMDLYEIVVEAYDFLIEGIKWQLLVFITTSFVSILGFLYVFCLVSINSGEVLTDYAILQVIMIVTLMAPIFSPCVFGESVHNEVRKLRELLASKLYENKLDKSGRSVARALLSFTETRDLSFRLLRMLNIDISLPFKFCGLIITYLIILLQFERVIKSES